MRTGATYIIFDGDRDRYAYALMRRWKANRCVELPKVPELCFWITSCLPTIRELCNRSRQCRIL